VTGAVLPLPEPPDEALVELLELVAYARAELADAHRVITMLAVDDVETPAWRIRRRIESTVAERRAELWALELAALTERAEKRGAVL
jgi:hypothetical protein